MNDEYLREEPNSRPGEFTLVGMHLARGLGLAETWVPLAGETISLFGKNGSGKSTILRELEKFFTPQLAGGTDHILIVKSSVLAETAQLEYGWYSDNDWDVETRTLSRSSTSHGFVDNLVGSLEKQLNRLFVGEFELFLPEEFSNHIDEDAALGDYGAALANEEFYQVAATGYLALQKTTQGTYTVSLAAPLDDTVPFVHAQIQQGTRFAENFREVRRKYERARSRFIESGELPDVEKDPDGIINYALSCINDAITDDEKRKNFFILLTVFEDPYSYLEFEDVWYWGYVPKEYEVLIVGPRNGVQFQPLWLIGHVRTRFCSVLNPDEMDADSVTRAWLTTCLVGKTDLTSDPEGSLGIEVNIGHLEATVNMRIAGLLPDPPTLVLVKLEDLEALNGKLYEWRQALPNGETVSLDSLSTVERRWAVVAVYCAIEEIDQERHTLWLIDEPEKGVHRSAEKKLIYGVSKLATSFNEKIIMASHSPAALELSDALVLHVKREGGLATVVLPGTQFRDSLDSLGLRPADLLSGIDAFLLVEGPHDETVLDVVMGDQLRELGIHTLWVEGSKNLPRALQSRFISDFTDARLVAVLDNLDNEAVNRLWNEAKQIHESGHSAKARDLLETELRNANLESHGELTSIIQFLIRGLENGDQNRLFVYGMSHKDIIRYLEPSSLVPNCDLSWDELDREHALQRETKKNVPRDFKAWFQKEYGFQLTTELIRKASSNLDHLHPDFTGLLSLLAES